jgi:hypothetical protein
MVICTALDYSVARQSDTKIFVSEKFEKNGRKKKDYYINAATEAFSSKEYSREKEGHSVWAWFVRFLVFFHQSKIQKSLRKDFYFFF